MKRLFFIFASIVLFSCSSQEAKPEISNKKMETNKELKSIVFGGGCFWCVEACFNMLKGTTSVVSGYSGGHKNQPTYEEVSTGETGHAEVVKIDYDPKEISLEQLMEVFFFLHDPTQLNRQGSDVGTQYRSIVFYANDAEKTDIEKALKHSEESGKWKGSYTTQIEKSQTFWPAESYHQAYYKANPTQPYCRAVVGPKIEKFRTYYAAKHWLKD